MTVIGRGYPYRDPTAWERLLMRLFIPRRHNITLDRAINEHLVCCGRSGAGKSVELYNLITQDIDRRQGAGLTDTHVDLFTHTLEYLIESGVAAKDTIIIDPCHKPEELGVVQMAMLETGAGEIPYEAVADLCPVARRFSKTA
jgi:hypothetical protein